jgi:hypothetical protein
MATVAVAFVAVATPQPMRAQSTVILATVRDSTGAPVHPCRIDVLGTSIFAFGDTLGSLVLPRVPVGRRMFRVRGVGFWEQQLVAEVSGDTLRLSAVVLRRNPVLDSLNIVAP